MDYAVRKMLTVSKEELQKREAEWQRQRQRHYPHLRKKRAKKN
jgi:hypothetical protein